jgi:N,N'-diacetyllegionaminate synthase
MVRALHIAGRPVGPGAPCFVIAEAGVNHNGDMDMAARLVDAAADAGADAVKFQTFRADRLAVEDAPKAPYQLADGAEESQAAMLRRLELKPEAHRGLQEHCARRGILFLSTPFDEVSADLLETLDVPAFKLGSGEVTNWPLLAHIARKGRPLILSTGMSTLDEVAAAVAVVRDAGDPPLALLHCVSAYPAPAEEANLHAMGALTEAFGVPVGFSDHSVGNDVSLAAVALGARIIEKHFTLDRTLPGPDHAASIEPDELTALVAGVRRVESALGSGVKAPTGAEAANIGVVRRSVGAVVDIPAGARIEAGMLAMVRPATGIPPARVGEVLGRTAARVIGAGSLLVWEDLA